jgi:hypothetical protein
MRNRRVVGSGLLEAIMLCLMVVLLGVLVVRVTSLCRVVADRGSAHAAVVVDHVPGGGSR